MIRIFIADDHPIIRHGIRHLLDQQPDIRVVGEASNGHQIMAAEGKDAWDVLLLDLSLPRLNGLEVLARLREVAPRVRVLVFSLLPEGTYAAQALKQGASGFLSKHRPPEELLAAIRAVARGQAIVPASILEQLRSPTDKPPHANLSAREYQVFVMLVEGRSVSDVAAELSIAASTASNHVAKVREKLGVASIADIVNYAHRAGLVHDPLDPG